MSTTMPRVSLKIQAFCPKTHGSDHYDIDADFSDAGCYLSGVAVARHSTVAAAL